MKKQPDTFVQTREGDEDEKENRCMGDVIVHDAERGSPDAGGHGICTGKRAGERGRAAAGELFDSYSGEDHRLS